MHPCVEHGEVAKSIQSYPMINDNNSPMLHVRYYNSIFLNLTTSVDNK